MFIDASAIVAIIKGEPEAQGFLAALEASRGKVVCSAIARFEAVISLAVQVSRANGAPAMTEDAFKQCEALVDELLREVEAREAHIGDGIGRTAREAALRYGKVAGHPAALNMGDCFAYACAKGYRVKLLYKGDDFAKTDLA